ncbi:MAG: HAMP domain-containing histidine kinase [Planctomycetes bacterium]|nr:HAMP domain-containing histidine kinase [Planctomycetota bacterium]
MPSYRTYVRPSLKKPVTIFVAILFLTVSLSVLWNVVLARDYARFRDLARSQTVEAGSAHWVYLVLGTALFLAIIGLVIWLAVTLFSAVKLNQQLSYFLAIVSHELNSPLSAIKLYAQTLRNQQLPAEERAKFVETILANVERLSRHIQNILRAAQEDQHRLRPVLEEVFLHEFVADYVAECRGLVERRLAGAAILFEEGSRVRVKLDRSLFRQVLDNLLDNAIKYAGVPPLRLVFRCRVDEHGFAALEVLDNGRGIPPDQMPWLFERFQRVILEDPAELREGVGLGLSIVRAIVLVHGGTVDVRSAGLGLGTTFRIALPLAGSAAPADGTGAGAASTGTGTGTVAGEGSPEAAA